MIVPRMPRWIILAILLLVVLGRSAVFVHWVHWPESSFGGVPLRPGACQCR